MKMKSILAGATIAVALAVSSPVWSCDAAGKNTHIGNLMTVNAEQSTFTIKDAQSQSPITFVANTDIIEGLKNANGNIMVNYEENGDTLTAIGVTF